MEIVRAVTLNGRRQAYRTSGPIDAPPLVLLHALDEQSDTWTDLAASLGTRNRIVAPDLRGHGSSDWTNTYSVELMVNDVVDLLDALGLTTVALLGHSLGAMVAYVFAQTHPDRISCLVLEEPPAPLPLPELRHLPSDDDIETCDPAVVAAVYAQRHRPDPAWWDGLTAIDSPTLVIGGGAQSHIPQTDVAAVAHRIPGGHLVTIAGGHLVHSSRPAEFSETVSAFLARSGRPQRRPNTRARRPNTGEQGPNTEK